MSCEAKEKDLPNRVAVLGLKLPAGGL